MAMNQPFLRASAEAATAALLAASSPIDAPMGIAYALGAAGLAAGAGVCCAPAAVASASVKGSKAIPNGLINMDPPLTSHPIADGGRLTSGRAESQARATPTSMPNFSSPGKGHFVSSRHLLPTPVDVSTTGRGCATRLRRRAPVQNADEGERCGYAGFINETRPSA